MQMHRMIMKAPEGVLIDHRNRDGLDNRKENLRLADGFQNHWNTKKPNNNTSGVKGVNWDKTRGKWMARLSINGVSRNIGRFDSLEEAKTILHNERLLHHGEFARDE